MNRPRQPWICVTPEGPDDGGDFGPRTPGTRTSGLQEALEQAHACCRDVYLCGGRGGLHRGEGVARNIYLLDETLRVPWSQDFRLDGGNCLLLYRRESGSAIHLDSQMNCRYKFGLVVSNSKDPVVLLKPQTPGPDDFAVITASLFDFSAICSGHPQGVSLQLDSGQGMIVNSRIFAEETNSTGTGVYLTDGGGAGQWLCNNQLQVMYGNQYHAGDHCIGLRLGDPGSKKILDNRLELSFHAPRGAYFDEEKKAYVTREDFVPKQAIGAQIWAQRNALTLSFYGKRAPGHDLVFGPDARENTVHTSALPNGLTNNARVPTNRLVTHRPVGFEIPTPPVPASGEWVINATCFAAQILIIEPGAVSQWTIEEAERLPQWLPYNLSLVDNLRRPPRPEPPSPSPLSQTIPAGLFPGQGMVLEPGEKLKLTYTRPPAWRWKALC